MTAAEMSGHLWPHLLHAMLQLGVFIAALAPHIQQLHPLSLPRKANHGWRAALTADTAVQHETLALQSSVEAPACMSNCVLEKSIKCPCQQDSTSSLYAHWQ